MQVYMQYNSYQVALRYMLENLFLLLPELLLLLGFGDGCLAVPDIHRGTHVIMGDAPQAATPYKNIRQENLVVSCTYIMKYYECYPTDLY